MRTSVPIFDLGCDGSLGCDCPEKRSRMPEHGDRHRYTYFGCRDAKCAEANTEYHRQWRANKEN